MGLGSAYAPDALVVEPVPALPILGALQSVAGGLLVWVPEVMVVAVAAVRVLTPRSTLSWRAQLAADGLAVLGLAVAVAGLCLAASGAAGPGRLSTVGPDPLPVAVAVAALASLGAALGTLVRLMVDLLALRRTVSRAAAPMPPAQASGTPEASAHRPLESPTAR